MQPCRKGSASLPRRSGCGTSGAVGTTGGLRVQAVGSHDVLCAGSFPGRGRGAASAPPDGDAAWGWAHCCRAWFPGGLMRVMIFVRNEQNPLKRPQKPKTAPRQRGPCQLIPAPREGWELPKLNSLFISLGFLRVTLPLFLVCL